MDVLVWNGTHGFIRFVWGQKDKKFLEIQQVFFSTRNSNSADAEQSQNNHVIHHVHWFLHSASETNTSTNTKHHSEENFLASSASQDSSRSAPYYLFPDGTYNCNCKAFCKLRQWTLRDSQAAVSCQSLLPTASIQSRRGWENEPDPIQP